MLVSLLLAAAAASAPAQSAACFGPCYTPGCANSSFWVCKGHTGVTRTFGDAPDGGHFSSNNRNDSNHVVRTAGGYIEPKPGKTWGDVHECSDLQGWC